MKKTEIHYAILGDGRLARHMRHYLTLLGHNASGWARNGQSSFNTNRHPDTETRLRRAIAPASHVLLLVTDDAIAPLVRKYPELHGKTLVHCAGALSQPGIVGAHPLMTFSHDLYSLEQYQRIPFLVEAGHEFSELFPGLSNPHHTVSVEQKSLYHALCVVAGNFPQLLWQAVSDRFEGQLDLPAEVMHDYLRQSLENFLVNPVQALTGPLARGDHNTIARNLGALAGDPLQAVYRAMADMHVATADDLQVQEGVS
jgi:predicted short-subunit dehydrogenase-like oxidoreductase (DUF2520 family)